jgi:hypothetical protein
MKHIVAVAFASLAVLPLSSYARVTTTHCPFSHFQRLGGTEIRTSTLGFRNIDLANAATIERITIRNAFGQIVHESGPATGIPHPLSGAFGGLDITVIPPGATLFLLSNDLWGLENVPGTAGPAQGFSMSVRVQVRKEGKADLLVVGSRQRSRDRIIGPTGIPSEGAERSTNIVHCATE